MKRQILSGLASLAIVSVALGRTAPTFINNSVMIFPSVTYPVPPQIDATNFINNSAFIDNTFNSLFVTPYATANTVNYTNFGVLGSLEGFRFDTFNTHTARYSRAGNLHNEVGAIINCGGTNNGPYFVTNAIFFSIAGSAECLVSATNIINRGTIEMGSDSLLSLSGQNVSLAGGLVNMEGFESGYPYTLTLIPGPNGSFMAETIGQTGIFDGYWGLGQTAGYFPAGSFTPFSASSPSYWVTNRDYSDMQTAMSVFPATTYLNAITNAVTTNGYDVIWQVVYLQNANPSMSNNVYFMGPAVVEWVWPSTNIVTGVASTNHLYLEDYMIGITNLALVTNGVAPPNTGYGATYIPTNYFFVESGLFFGGLPATSSVLPDIFTPNKRISTEFTAYKAIFQPTTVLVGEVTGQTYANMPGRIEITADKQLDLRSSRISGLNYLRLTATNNFTRDPSTRILSAIADYNLGVTNATMTVSNLLAPTCPRLNGYVDVFSTRWTNIAGPFTNYIYTNVFYNTNTYFVTMVASQLASSSPSFVQNLTLHAPTNVIISDVLNVLSNITIDAYNVTITTNGPGAQTPAGQLNFPSGMDLGSSAFPRLRALTNYGIISVQNAASFGAPAKPLWDFVNHGSVLAMGCSVWATNFENTGLVDAGAGPINLTATSAVLSNGVFNAPYNDITLAAGSLLISNQVLKAGHRLTVWATNSLTDGGPDNGSIWTAGVLGFSLPFEPPIASLLGTTITDTAPAWASVINQWAGQDRGPSVAGYSNNAALGRLILDGGLNSSFVLTGSGAANALYVDYLEFRNYATNFDGIGNLVNLQFGPGMKIYYAQLIMNGVSLAEKLNHKNNGGLNWVSAYAGAFSSTNMVYPDGTTNRLNLALVQSCDLDSNGNGIANCQDPAPVFVPSQVGLAVAFANPVAAIAAGRYHSLALKRDGTVVTWWAANSAVQYNVPGLSNVVAIAAGGYHSLALKQDGTVVMWWATNSAVLYNVPGLTNVVAIAAGGYHSMALKSNGTVVAWGDNSYGQCNVPGGLNNVAAIAAGEYHSVALKRDGTVVAWGQNSYGQCNVPDGLNNVTAIAAGGFHSLALKSDGTVVAWGDNSSGQCNVFGLSTVTAIAAGRYHSLALKQDGNVAAWGDQDWIMYPPPGEFTAIAAIAAGGSQSLALEHDGTISGFAGNVSEYVNLGGLRYAALSWNTIPYSTNFVYFKSSVTAADWQPLTNAYFTNPFVFNSPVAGRTNIVDPLGAGARFYRVRVDAAAP